MNYSDNVFEEQRWLLSPGSLEPLIREFTKRLRDLDYARMTIVRYSAGARHFGEWLHRTHILPEAITNKVIDRFARHQCRCSGYRKQSILSKHYILYVHRFVDFLIEKKIVQGPPPKPESDREKQIREYLEWCCHHCGITNQTVKCRYKLMKKIMSDIGHDSSEYTATLVRRMILAYAKKHSPRYTQLVASVFRGYLKYLAVRGKCPPSLVCAIPTVAEWKLSSLPRYISVESVERIINSCDLTKPKGVRNRAILLLLARLGLRPLDIVNMRLDDIFWHNSTFRVSGKSRREVHLPLPQDAGDALLLYLQEARPATDETRIFLKSCAPYRPFSNSYSVSSIVTRAMERAGINDAPTRRGAYLLRHSAATNMLRGGATLETVGAVLRHRSPHTTMIYAKVDIPMLEKVALPWPGGLPC